MDKNDLRSIFVMAINASVVKLLKNKSKNLVIMLEVAGFLLILAFMVINHYLKLIY